jgi:imidazole glycerol-phosphate synthase subunit HisF
MLTTRVIPVLLLKNAGLVKTIKFKDPTYIGDPINAVKIFNDKGVDELVFLDITATRDQQEPNCKRIAEIASECFMPLAYGGGIRNIDQIKKILAIGCEKAIINSYAVENPSFIKEAAKIFGSQSVVVSIDVKKTMLGKYEIWTESGTKNVKINPVNFAQDAEAMGAGELVINSIDRDGTMNGYDIDLIKQIASAVSIPVIACGGGGNIGDLGRAVVEGRASAVGAGSMFVFHGPHRAVLINFPSEEQLKSIFRR